MVADVKTLIPASESLTVEFKSDRRCLSDTDLVEAVVCLSNAEGGELWLGVEDDGTPTGLHAEHRLLAGLAGLVAARTSPSVHVSVTPVEVSGVTVARIDVPKAAGEVATHSGVYLRRRIKHDGTPECAPMLPHERISRATHLGVLDVSAQVVDGASLDDFDPLERERLRQAIQQYGGDRVLLELDDEALDGALGLTVRQRDGSRLPSLTGMLLVGREAALRQWLPSHELAFQVLAQQAVKFNEFRCFPLLKALEWLETNFRPYNPEQELQVGLFRVPVPLVDMATFREAVANALIHRDYHRLGAVHVRLEDNALVVSNPGGLVDGVTLANLLVTEPRPRNRALADAMKRIGVVERSGRGVDTIYRGMLKFGRAAPDYSHTDSQNVVVRLSTAPADLAFRRMVVEEENRRQAQLPIDSLIALGALRELRRLSAEELAERIQRDVVAAKHTLESLIEAGFVEAHGATRSRTYILSAAVYDSVDDKAAYTRQVGFTPIQHEQMVMNYLRQHGRIKRAETMELCRLSEGQSKELLKRMTRAGLIALEGAGRTAHYRIVAVKSDEIG
ncbi:DNA-binding protein [Betaproteobacteria bacterium]|nr:DNA-binding protein [Betaproteobacteria bacterium]